VALESLLLVSYSIKSTAFTTAMSEEGPTL